MSILYTVLIVSLMFESGSSFRDYEPSDGPCFKLYWQCRAQCRYTQHTADTQNINQAEPGCLLLPKRYLHS